LTDIYVAAKNQSLVLFQLRNIRRNPDVKPKGVPLHIGIPKETAFQETVSPLTPDAVGVLVSNGHEVVIEHNAGRGLPLPG